MGIWGMKSRWFATVLSASLLLGISVVPGCAKKSKADPDPQYVSKHDSLEVLSELKKRTEGGVRYSLQGGVSKIDGKTEEYNSFKYEMKEFIDALLELDMEYVDDWDPGKLTYPVYEINLETIDDTVEDYSQLTDDQKKEAYLAFGACWSDGYLITASGDVLKCDTDFEKLCECLGERSKLDHFGFNTRVFSRVSALWHDKWDPENMMKLEDYLDDRFTSSGMTVNKADGWSAEFKSFAPGNITVTLKNDSAPGLIYGNGYAHVFKKIDGTWYLVPEDPNLKHVYFAALGYVLHTGESVDLELVCGELPKGDYALLVDLNTGDTGCFEYTMAEFTV